LPALVRRPLAGSPAGFFACRVICVARFAYPVIMITVFAHSAPMIKSGLDWYAELLSV
jgi:hypothetical protein